MHSYTLETVADYLSSLHDERIVFTNGCFDLLHPGHVQYLTTAKAFGDLLIVGLNSDDSVRRLKGPRRPINNASFRATMLLALKPVDAVVVFDEDTPISLLHIIRPAIHVKGGDYQADKLPEYDTVVSNGGEVRIVPFLDGFSSTSLINKSRLS